MEEEVGREPAAGRRDRRGPARRGRGTTPWSGRPSSSRTSRMTGTAGSQLKRMSTSLRKPEVLRPLADVEADLGLAACRRRGCRSGSSGIRAPGPRGSASAAGRRTSPRPSSAGGLPAGGSTVFGSALLRRALVERRGVGALDARARRSRPASLWTLTRKTRQPCWTSLGARRALDRLHAALGIDVRRRSGRAGRGASWIARTACEGFVMA